MARSVAIVFADSSLGGTSRSAIAMAQVWGSLGWSVRFVPLVPVSPTRASAMAVLGPSTPPSEMRWESIDVIHLHMSGHAIFESEFARLRASLEHHSVWPDLLVHNIFAYPEPFLRHWRGKVATAVLGTWAARQYKFSRFSTIVHSPFVIPNPQDDAFFRAPSPDEIREARDALNLDSDLPVILRVGSPYRDKWSDDYVNLAASARNRSMQLLLYGIPEDLQEKLRPFTNVHARPLLGDDRMLRQAYWAADVFALDARRGESFGNVIAEALLCGLPVTYRAHEFRDNTPWEMRGVEGFSYSRQRRAWLEATLTSAERGAQRRRAKALRGTDRSAVAASYGFQATAGHLLHAVSAMADAPANRVWDVATVGRELSQSENARVLALHNPVVAGLKMARRSVHARRHS